MKVLFTLPAAVLAIAVAAGVSRAEEKPAKPERFTFRVTGLFSPDREKDLRAAFAEIADVALTAVAFDDAEITVEFAPAKAFPGAKPADFAAQLDQKVRTATNHTFGVKPRRTVPADKLTEVVIPVLGLDCKACCLAAYEAVAVLDGVEQATASFKDGKVTARIDPAKTDRAKLEAALRQKGVTLPKP